MFNNVFLFYFKIGIEELYIQIDYVSSSFAHVTDSNIL